ncbi:MAG TPA: hypothetical protein VGB67_00555 [Fibrella sp.]|jgi:hypothetical protein
MSVYTNELDAEIAVNQSLRNQIRELQNMTNYLTLDNGQIINVGSYEVVTKESIENAMADKRAQIELAQAEINGLQDILSKVNEVAPPVIETDAPGQPAEVPEISQAAPEAPAEPAHQEQPVAEQPEQLTPTTPQAPMVNDVTPAPQTPETAPAPQPVIDLN